MNLKETDMDNGNIFEVNNSFYDKYNPQIRAIVTRILSYMNQSSDIDDCVNTVYLELMEKLQQYNEVRGSMGAFVAIVARSSALDYCRGNMRENGNFSVKDKNQIDFIREPLNFENEVEFEMLVEHILGKLNEKENILFTMKFILFYSTDEIAKIFNIRRNTVDVRINRLKSKVKKLLIKGGITL